MRTRTETEAGPLARRVELDPSLEPARVPRTVVHEICRHALDAMPEECCGLVLGRRDERFARTVRITNVMTKKHLADPRTFPRDALHAYYMSEIEYHRAIQEAEVLGEQVSAVYHSHVGQACYLSEDDLAFAAHPLFPFPDAAQIVVSLVESRVAAIGLFEPVGEAEARHFEGRRVEVQT